MRDAENREGARKREKKKKRKTELPFSRNKERVSEARGEKACGPHPQINDSAAAVEDAGRL